MPYGVFEYTGNKAKDTICLGAGGCLEDFEYVYLKGYYNEIGSYYTDGIMGLARPDRPMLLNPSYSSNRTPFMLKAM